MPLPPQAFYQFAENPFGQTSDPRFFYPSRSHARAFDELSSAIRARQSVSALIGEVGTGKTTLCRSILQHLPRYTLGAFVPDPAVSREDLLKMLLVDFGVVTVADIVSGRLREATRTELSYLLGEFLGSQVPGEALAVVFVEEAQRLSAGALEELRIIADSDGRLQLVLVGQPQLRARLAQPEMRHLEQRISVSCQLAPLDGEAVAGYIAHRLAVVDAGPDRPRFTADAVMAIHRSTRGIPRLINRLCDRLVREASLAEATTIDRALVEASLIDPIGVWSVATPLSAAPPVARGIRASDPIAAWLDKVDESFESCSGAAFNAEDSPNQPDARLRVVANPFAARDRSFRPSPSKRRVPPFPERLFKTIREVVSAVTRVPLNRHR